MNDETYRELASQVSRGNQERIDELADEARRRDDRATLLTIELVRGPDEKTARERGDRLALGRAMLSRERSSRTWEKLVSEVEGWPDDQDTRAIVDQLAQLLDQSLWPDLVREAPAAWWNASQRDAAPVGWPLVRTLRLRLVDPRQRFDPCSEPSALGGLHILQADDGYLDLDKLPAAVALRQLIYRLDEPASLAPLAELPRLERLHLEFAPEAAAPGLDFSVLAGADAVRDLKLEFQGDEPMDLESLRPVAAAVRLDKLAVVGPGELRSADPIRGFSELRALTLEHAAADLGAIAALDRLEHLEVHAPASWPPDLTLPATITELHVSHAPGLRTTRSLGGARSLRRLMIHGCPDLEELDLSGFAALEYLSLGALPARNLSGLAGLGAVRELHLDDLPELEDMELPDDKSALELITVYGCPKLAAPALAALADLADGRDIRVETD